MDTDGADGALMAAATPLPYRPYGPGARHRGPISAGRWGKDRRGCWCHGGRGGALQGVCWGLGRQHLAPLAWPPPRDTLRTPQPTLRPQHASSLRDSVRDSLIPGPLPQHTGAEGPSSPVQGTGVGGWLPLRGQRRGNAPALGPWVPGVTDIQVQQSISQASAQNTASLTGRGPANVSRCPVGSPFRPLLRQATVKEIPHPTQPGQGLALMRPTPNPPQS